MSILLLADVGGTHTRLCLCRFVGQFDHVEVVENRKHASLDAIVAGYLQRSGVDRAQLRGRFAIAAPVEAETVRLTNLDWSFSRAELCAQLGLEQLELVNDFTAIALALPYLRAVDRVAIGGGTPAASATMAIIGPGTGLGVSGLVPCGEGWAPLDSEGGHVTLAAADEQEEVILGELRYELGHVSAERLLAAPGLAALYRVLAGSDEYITPERVTRLAASGGDAMAVEALDLYFAMLGGVAGDLALTLGARGGVYLAGGLLPQMIQPLQQSRFRERFVAKGRFEDYLANIPCYVVTHPYPALLGMSAP